ncbi:hypothetical protein IAD21_01093 [Abditibacteriota bacterium]|nr:hypothetical protein IAD21_01093 [Abditibacteriota bacterium]
MNSITRRQLLVGVGTLFVARLALAMPYATPVQSSDIWRAEWHDAKRNRNVPVKIYFPKGNGPFPVIMFSHGLGGTREMYQYLGSYWAAHGFVAVHLQHIGSDDSVWRGGVDRQNLMGAMSSKNALDRVRDVSFAIDQLQSLNNTQTWPLHGKLDLSHIGMAGHSFGANTTLMVSGLKLPMGGNSVSDPRIKCAIAMSSPSPVLKNYNVIYGGIKIPMFHMTGTQDVSPVDRNGTTPLDRRLPYDHIRGADAYLTTFAGGDHMVFSGRSRPTGAVASDERNHLLIQESSTAFWDAYLKGDAKAMAWLHTDFAKELGVNGVFEQKVGKG